MALTFDTSGSPGELVIQLDTTTLSYTAAEIYSAWKDWASIGDNAKWPPAFRVVGGDSLGGGSVAPSFFFVRNDLNWRVRKPEADIDVLIDGNLVAEDPNTVFSVPPQGPFVPTLTISLTSVASADLDAFAEAVIQRFLDDNVLAQVWDATRGDHVLPGSFGQRIDAKKVHVDLGDSIVEVDGS